MSEGNVKLCKDLQSLPTHIHHLRQIIFDTLKIFNLIFLNKVLLNIIFIQFSKHVKPGPLFIPPSNKARCASPPPPPTQTCCTATNTSQTCIQTFVINIPCRILTPPPLLPSTTSSEDHPCRHIHFFNFSSFIFADLFFLNLADFNV